MLFIVSMTLTATACSGSVPRKSGSLWDQRRDALKAKRPVASEYRQELAVLDKSINDAELRYQAEQVEGFTAEATGVQANQRKADIEKQILTMPSTYYTVQLLASADIDRVYKFAEKNQLPAKYILPTVRDKATLYILLLDVYKDYSAASMAKENISAALVTEPWVRSIASVQEMIH